ncbi:uncharacterized protein BO80DRAFT_497258 [Aspergillus ibericus CBS 121593]|uniref:BTB domain-containing protein n=1 Tax=Aspergillus ibericus CBS 121593 TaxID=1448316 RepID=A0A395GL49_9EURO|nr:hypothetical protein BO80DRAFT_497258 [Aspergillus ibericus CBS 121593]RAK96114.1 hypothetical protein BO80DRAFT_497258 [Aspergillus ibericus CBS 121593]
MASEYDIIDPRGDMLLLVEKHAGQFHTRLLTVSASSTLANEGPEQSSGELVRATKNNLPSPDITQARIRVSSKHLAFSSRFFQEKFSSEERLNQEDILPPCFNNLGALYVLLNAMHCRARNVPRHITLDTLCMLAILIEEYECLEAVEVFAETWIMNLSEGVPKMFNKDAGRWLYIALAFRNNVLFHHMTRIAIRESPGPVPTFGLPVPNSLIGHIEHLRQHKVDSIVISLYERMEYLLDHGGCCRSCDTMIIGSMMLQLKPRELFPPPQAPYEGLSVEHLLRIVSGMQEPRCMELFHEQTGCPAIGCSLMPTTRLLLRRVDHESTGLELDSFLSG